jgi:exopolysaccharide biosynthesis polyprenyl glycosylphosphotransferase
MIDKRSVAVASVLVCAADAVFIFVSFLVSFWIRFHSGLIPLFYENKPTVSSYTPGIIFACLISVMVFRFMGLYRMPRNTSFYDEMLKLFKGMVLAAMITMAATFLYRGAEYSRLVFALSWSIGLIAVWACRYVFRRIQTWAFEHGHLSKNVAIVGIGPMACSVIDRIDSNPGLGFRVLGYIGTGENPIDIPYLGRVQDIGDLVRERGLDSLVVALPYSEHEQLMEVLSQTEGMRVDVRFVPDLFGLVATRTEIHDLDGIPLIGLKPFPLDPWGRFLKRLTDVVMSTLFLGVFSPLIALIAVAIRLESPGGVFYRQDRVGRDGRRFTMYKFRSMRSDAEKDGPVWGKGADDPRNTRVGWLLRRTGLDEIPQIVNVLKGDMSLIGPRPERPCFVSEFANSIPGYLDRHRVKSGVTGWAQVNGFRGDTSMKKRTECDIYYVENWSLGLDIKIMLMTIRHIITEGVGWASREMET